MRMLQPGVGLLISVASGVEFPCHGGLDVRVASLGIRRLHGRRKMRFQEHAALAGDAPLRYSRSESGSRKVLGSSSSADESSSNESGFCIIEGPETVQDFAQMELQEIRDNIKVRRNKIFLFMEEVRRLRIQQRINNAEQGVLDEKEEEIHEYPSSIPFFPPILV